MTLRRQQSGISYVPTMEFGPISGPVVGSMAALALTVVIWAANRAGGSIPLWLPLAFAGFGITVATVTVVLLDVRHPGRPGRIPKLVFVSVCWAGSGIWAHATLSWASSNPMLNILVLIGATVFAGLISAALGAVYSKDLDEQAVPAEEPPPALPAVDGAGEDEWPAALQYLVGDMLRLRKNEMVTVNREKTWNENSGATFRVKFSVGSSKGRADIEGICGALQQALNLDDGCIISTRRSGVQGVVLLDVMWVNDMEAPVYYPSDYKPRSVIDDINVGRNGDKTCALVNLYQKSMMIQGIRGGGKSGLMHNLTASLVQCRDVVIWHVDMKSGAMSQAWMTPTAKGEIEGYPIDWVAHNETEALLMAKAAHRITLGRASVYAHLTISGGKDILPISAEIPMLLIMVDEAGELAGDDAGEEARQAMRLFRAVQRLGRAVCVNIIFSVQRSTSDYVPVAVKKMTTIKISLRVDDDAELAYLFEWSKNLRSDDLVWPGQAFMKVTLESGAPSMIKLNWIMPPQISDVVLACIGWRPALDRVSADFGGPDYYKRWQRPDNQAWLANLRGNTAGYTAVSARAATAVAERRVQDKFSGLEGIEAELSKLNNEIAGTPTGPSGPGNPPAGGGRDAWKDPMDVDRFLAGLQGLPETVEPEYGNAAAGSTPTPAKAELSNVEWCYQFIDSKGPGGVETKDIIAGARAAGLLGERERTVQDWMTKLRNTKPPRIVKVVEVVDGSAKEKFGWWRSDRHAG